MDKELILDIEEISNLGAGIAKKDGMVIFIENTCPKDKVKARIIKQTKKYAIAELLEVIVPSMYRVQPICPMQKICGACQLQFIDYNYQLKIKQRIVEDSARNLENVTVGETIPSPDIKNYRHKIQYPISETQHSKRILAGYYKSKSHEIVNIKYCPIQPQVCDEIIEYIRETAPKYGIRGYKENKHSGDLRHVVIRSSKATGKNLVVLVVNATKMFGRLVDFANAIYTNFKDVSGVCVNFNSKKTNLILSDKTELVVGKDFIKERLCDITFRIGANTFFQINPSSAENIFRYVKKYISETFDSPTILDAYAGIAAFGIVMSDVCKKVVSVEENKESIEIASEVLKLNDINNVELHSMDTAKFLEKELQTKNRKFDITILDPPRKGCTEESLEKTLKLTKSKIIYVSCNPQTLCRDLEYLISKGAKVSFIQPFDMFCHTYHVESVAIIDVEGITVS